MKVSIIITNFNYGKFIDRCIRSCMNQNYSSGIKNLNKDFEVIVIDDCSKDDSREKIIRYKDLHNFKYIFNKKNIGVAASANKAILKSKGKYFIRIDADDYISVNLINILSFFLDENPSFFGVSCDYFFVDELGSQIKKISSKENPIACGIMYNKKKFIKYGMYNKKFRHREEEELRLRLGNKYKIYNLPFPFYRYRMHKSNKTKSVGYLKDFKDKIKNISLKKLVTKKRNFFKNIVAIIPARGNSKRFKNKNIYKIKKKPMVVYTIDACKNSYFVDHIYVSSENKKILEISKKNKANIIKRPYNLSEDHIFKMEVIKHALIEIEKKLGKKASLVASLQANSPEITSEVIDKSIMKLVSNDLNEVISVDENLNSNAAIRIMKRDTVFQKSLSTYLGCIKTNINDIHYKSDIKKVNI
jgi:CMP-N-acetylneuraminic acid synthetase